MSYYEDVEELFWPPKLEAFGKPRLLRLARASGKKTYLLENGGQKAIAKCYPPYFSPAEERLKTLALLHQRRILVPSAAVLEEEDQFTVVEEKLEENFLTFLPRIAQDDRELRAAILQVAETLHRFHDEFGFHGNLKPGNLLVSRGNHPEFFLADPYPGNEPAFWQRDPDFAAPECLRKARPEKKSDWWSLGMTLLATLTRRHPFQDAPRLAVPFLLSTAPIPIPDDFPPFLWVLLKGLLQQNPEKRWGYEEIKRWANGETVPIEKEPEPQESEPFLLEWVSLRIPEHFVFYVIGSEAAWEEGKRYLKNERFLAWLSQTSHRQDLGERIAGILEEETDPDWALWRVLFLLYPEVPLAFGGQILLPGNETKNLLPLVHFLRRWLREDHHPKTTKIVEALLTNRLLSRYSREQGNDEALAWALSCEQASQKGQSLPEKAELYCALLLGKQKDMSFRTAGKRPGNAEEHYAAVQRILDTPEPPEVRYRRLFELLETLYREGNDFPPELESEFAQAAELRKRRPRKENIDRFIFPLASLVIRSIAHLSATTPPPELQFYLSHRFPLKSEPPEELVDLTNLRVEKPPRRLENGGLHLVAWHRLYGEIHLFVFAPWEDEAASLSPGDTLTVHQARKGKNPHSYLVDRTSTLLLEPDFLLELSDLAEALDARTLSPKAFFLAMLLPREGGKNMILGILLGKLIAASLDSANPPEELLREILAEDPVTLLRLMIQTGNALAVNALQQEVLTHYAKVQNFLRESAPSATLCEETLLSPAVGLIGRADLMLREENRWKIVEIKSGQAPRGNPWPNHRAQIVGYAILAESLGIPLTPQAALLYTAAPTLPEGKKILLPEAFEKQRLLRFRNQVLSFRRRFETEPLKTLEELFDSAGQVPNYCVERFAGLRQHFLAAPPLSKKYYAHLLAFLLREEHLARSGLFFGSFSSLWKRLSEEKKGQNLVLQNLTWDETRSNPQENLFAFSLDPSEENHADFRAGDRVFLTPQDPEEGEIPFCLSGTLKEITAHSLTVEAQSRRAFLYHLKNTKSTCYTLEHDLYARQVMLMRMLAFFLTAPSQKQELLLGLRRPRFSSRELPLPLDHTLRPEQHHIIRQAFQAEDYFLIQGPPGTGKTKVILTNLVRLFLAEPQERVLLLAFTNRAVDEICGALKASLPGVSFLRLGNAALTEHRDLTPQEVFRGKTPEEMYHHFRTLRVLISTVDSCLSNWDLVTAFSPTTAVVDEASQLLEPHLLGILSTIRRFILIGDERQLPAVVVQSTEDLTVTDQDLRAAGIINFGMSLFERLLRTAQKNGWSECFHTLRTQGRMHREIQHLADTLSYGGILSTMKKEQEMPIQGYCRESPHLLERLLATARVLFIPTPRESGTPRVHRGQKDLVLRFIATIESLFGPEKKDLGVITPFRAQVHEIRKSLRPEWHTWVQVDTVERFQGAEKDIIILSLAVNSLPQLRFIQSFPPEPFLQGRAIVDRKLNVALTRAREHLVILGVPEVLLRSAEYRELLELIEHQGGYVHDPEILLKLWNHSPISQA